MASSDGKIQAVSHGQLNMKSISPHFSHSFGITCVSESLISFVVTFLAESMPVRGNTWPRGSQNNVIFMFNELRMMPVYCLPTWFADLKYEIFDTSTMPSDTVSCSTWPFAWVKVHKLWCENPNSMLCMITALVFKYWEQVQRSCILWLLAMPVYLTHHCNVTNFVKFCTEN